MGWQDMFNWYAAKIAPPRRNPTYQIRIHHRDTSDNRLYRRPNDQRIQEAYDDGLMDGHQVGYRQGRRAGYGYGSSRGYDDGYYAGWDSRDERGIARERAAYNKGKAEWNTRRAGSGRVPRAPTPPDPLRERSSLGSGSRKSSRKMIGWR